MRILLTWSDRGVTGPRPAHHGTRPDSDRGPALRLIDHAESRYDRILVFSVPEGVAPAQELVTELRGSGAAVDLVVVGITDPTDYGQLFRALGDTLARLRHAGSVLSGLSDRSGLSALSGLSGLDEDADRCDVLLSAGTPQMQTLWVILVQAGLLPARMLQVIPAAFVPVPHPHAIREVSLDIEGFPEIRALRAEVLRLRARAQIQAGDMIGDSPPMRLLVDRAARVAPTDVPVLILGETGTGKELLARAMHQASARAGGPFIAENCGAFAESVLASELFGHEPGAFTGATGRRRGLFELASGGTLFLDEVAELSAQAQATLLRVLQEGELRRVGGERTTRIDVRLIAATHGDLGAMVAQGRFRQDLYYRLRGITLHIPPLRERVSDIEQLVACFLAQGERQLTPTRAAWQALRRYPWPGNVRELRAEVLRWTVLCRDARGTIDISDLADEIRYIADAPRPPGRPHDAGGSGDAGSGAGPDTGAGAGTAALRPLAEIVAEAERSAVAATLAACGGNLSQSARALAIDRNTLKRKIRLYEIGNDTLREIK